jgi:hypothetical protein
MSSRDEQRSNMVDNHQAHPEAKLIKELSDFILNLSPDQHTAIQNRFLAVTSTLPACIKH